MPKFSTYVDVDIHEFMEECSKREIKELIDYLVEDGHIKPSSKITHQDKK
jgi:predicted HTH domain antitoxin